MAEPFLGEIQMFGFNFPPRGWTFADGAILPISQNQSLYSLYGTTYGGDGRTSFQLPDLRGRVPVHRSTEDPAFIQGNSDGQEPVQLTLSQLPAHTHTLQATSDASSSNDPQGNVLATVDSTLGNIYAPAPNLSNLVELGETTSNTGGNQGRANMQPYQVINFCVALTGLFPSRN